MIVDSGSVEAGFAGETTDFVDSDTARLKLRHGEAETVHETIDFVVSAASRQNQSSRRHILLSLENLYG